MGLPVQSLQHRTGSELVVQGVKGSFLNLRENHIPRDGDILEMKFHLVFQ